MALEIKQTDKTVIDVTDNGYVRIEQQDAVGNEPAVVLLSAAQLQPVIKELQALYRSRATWELGKPHEKPTPAATWTTAPTRSNGTH